MDRDDPIGRRLRAYLASAIAALTLAALAAGRAPAQVTVRPARVEVVAPAAPTPVVVDTERVLVYELHVTNLGAGSLALHELTIMDAARPAVPLASVRDSALDRAVALAGAPMGGSMAGSMAGSMGAANRTRLDPGLRATVFVWLPIGAHGPRPALLRHRFLFDILDSTARQRDHGTQSVLDSVMVPVRRESAPVLLAPLHGGQWVAGGAPSNTSDHRRALNAINGHARIAERFAIDWNMVGPNGDTHHGDEHVDSSYWGYGQLVYAVAPGQVVAVVDSIADHAPHTPPPPVTLATIAGNYVTVRIGPARYATYAHLQRGTLRVHIGQAIAAGEQLARVGNTGQTTAPHLHFQLTDGPSVLDSEGIPYVLSRYTDLGPGQTFEEDKHPSTPRRRALPGDNEVVGLP